ncbi:MAG: ThuA domain-containing protein [Lentisphaeraceae bacterium]|nr:ThuA domain-containing protein [Lentisphaeraceae bacterium]
MKKVILSTLLIFLSFSLLAKEKALLIDGKNPYHKWQETSALIKTVLSSDFDIVHMTHSETEWQNKSINFNDYKTVILNYWGKWPDKLFYDLEAYLKNGGGLVSIHASLASFPEQKEFAEMVGIKWQDKSADKRIYLDKNLNEVIVEAGHGADCGHSKQFIYDVKAAPKSFIKEEIESNPKHNKDEMYHALRGPLKNLSISAYGKSPNTNKNEPLIWTVNYGKGRSFVTTLGHSPEAMKSEVFTKTLLKGTLWTVNTQAKSVATKPISKRVQPSKETIAKYTDESIPVYGKYSMVKLPIKTGVKLWNPTAITRDKNDVMWAANYTGEVYSLHDTDGDGLEDHAQLFCDVKQDKLRYPTCLAWKNGELYVGTTQEIRAYKDSDGDLKADSSRIFFNDFPWTLHWWDWTFAIEFGPDDHAYVIFCTDYLNRERAPDPKKYRGAIVKISPDGKHSEIFASGARFAYGMAFNQHGDLFFSDNKSGGNPTEELNFAEQGKFYGHDTTKFPNRKTTAPLLEIKDGYGPSGLEFNELSNDFGGTAGNLFLVCWGPDGKWNRGSLLRIELEKQKDGSYKAEQHLVAGEFAKIVDAKFSKAGDLYITQFGREGKKHTPYKQPEGSVYRMIHTPWKKTPVYKSVIKSPVIAGDTQTGKKIFDTRCTMCHDMDSLKITKLGPPLKGIGNMFNKSEILKAINEPSNGIKTDYETHEITKKDGTKMLGRVTGIDEEGVRFMLPGNVVILIKNEDIKTQKMLDTSLMPKGLLTGLSDSELNALLAYMKVRKENIARYAKASSPDGHKKDGKSGGDAAAIDGNIDTFWDEEDNKSEYVLQLDFDKDYQVAEIVIHGFGHNNYSPKSFDIILDGKKVHSVNSAKYKDSIFKIKIPKTKCKTLSLKINESYGPSPAIRELEVYE